MYYCLLIIFFLIGFFIGRLTKHIKPDGRFIVEEDENNLIVKLDVDFDPLDIKNHKQVLFTVYKVGMEEQDGSRPVFNEIK